MCVLFFLVSFHLVENRHTNRFSTQLRTVKVLLERHLLSFTIDHEVVECHVYWPNKIINCGQKSWSNKWTREIKCFTCNYGSIRTMTSLLSQMPFSRNKTIAFYVIRNSCAQDVQFDCCCCLSLFYEINLMTISTERILIDFDIRSKTSSKIMWQVVPLPPVKNHLPLAQ